MIHEHRLDPALPELVLVTGEPASGDPTELELLPTRGTARWLGPQLHRLFLRALSMIELPTRAMSGPLTPISAYFRRDRHRHPDIDPTTWRLCVSGVAEPRELALQDLRAMPSTARICVMECAGNGNEMVGSSGLIGQARWEGPALATVLAACGGPGRATHFAFHGLDRIGPVKPGYHYGLSLEELARARAIVALKMNGELLPRARGFPARLIVPGIYGMSHVKWLHHIEGKTAPHDGVHNRRVFTNEEKIGGRWTRVQVRGIGLKSLVTRCLRAQHGWLLTGWAWGGDKQIAGVEVSTDGGASWSAALVEPSKHEHAWSVWSWPWEAPQRGLYLVGSRARASDGSLQALERSPDVRGHFDHTQVQWRRVRVP